MSKSDKQALEEKKAASSKGFKQERSKGPSGLGVSKPPSSGAKRKAKPASQDESDTFLTDLIKGPRSNKRSVASSVRGEDDRIEEEEEIDPDEYQDIVFDID